VKLGQPQPASNFVSDSNSAAPQHTQVYCPSAVWFQYWPVKARSVPFWRVTRYCSGVSCARHSASLFSIFVDADIGNSEAAAVTALAPAVPAGWAGAAGRPHAVSDAARKTVSHAMRIHMLDCRSAVAPRRPADIHY